MEQSRKIFIGGNWKSNLTVAQTQEFVKNCINYLQVDSNRQEVVIAPVALQIPLIQQQLTNKDVQIAGQNASATSFGAYTGEITPDHLIDIGVRWVILGHSERRQYYGETDEVVSKKTNLALTKGLNVILCVGERLEERENNQTLQVVESQLKAVADNIQKEHWSNIVVAYEPVWAIGTGKTATPEQAQDVHAAIRSWLHTNVSQDVSHHTRIIYGGSVNEKNAETLIHQTDIDGFLVGGASIKPEFNQIVEASKFKGKK